MAKQYRTREGEATAVDTKSQLSTLGSESAPGPLLVPAGVSKLVEIIVAVSQNFAAATSFGAFIRLEGAGLPGGPETFAIGAGGAAVATGGNNSNSAIKIPIDVNVTPANEILIFAEMTGTDIGQMSSAVTLVFA